MSDISERGSDFIRDLGETARKNPVSADRNGDSLAVHGQSTGRKGG